MTVQSPTYLVLGQLHREYLITPSQKVYVDQPGGNLLYAAEGVSLWLNNDEVVGLVSRVGENYPRNWLEDYTQKGYNVDGIRILPDEIDLRSFRAYIDLRTSVTDDPVSHFARLELTFPRSLLGYKDSGREMDEQNDMSQLSLRQTDIPDIYRYARTAHICPVDYITHSLIPAVLRQEGINTITLDPGKGYMHSDFWNLIPSLVAGLNVFIPAEEDLRELFKGRSEDIFEIGEAMEDWGCEIIVIKRAEKGQLLFDYNGKRKYEISAYPSKIVDLTGVGDVFCGGFLAGYCKTCDPLQAVLYGNVTASIAIEGSGAFYSRDVLSGLKEARLDRIKSMIREV